LKKVLSTENKQYIWSMYLTKENIMNSSATILVRSSFVITTISTMTL